MMKKKLLFICTANRYRSPFAEVVFRQLLEDDGFLLEWEVNSAGTWTENDLPAIDHVVKKAKDLDMDLKQHRSLEVTCDLLLEHDLTLVMEKGHREALFAEFPKARERVFLLSEIVDGVAYDIPDPARFPKEAEEILNELHTLLKRGYQKIIEKGNSLVENKAA